MLMTASETSVQRGAGVSPAAGNLKLLQLPHPAQIHTDFEEIVKIK